MNARQSSILTMVTLFYLECGMYIGRPLNRRTFLLGIQRLEELSRGGRDLVILGMIRQRDRVSFVLDLSQTEHQFGDVLVGDLVRVAMVTLRHFLQGKHGQEIYNLWG